MLCICPPSPTRIHVTDTWTGPLGALLLVGCCLLLETGRIGGGLATGVAALGYSWVGLFVVGVTASALVAGWMCHGRSGELQEQDS